MRIGDLISEKSPYRPPQKYFEIFIFQNIFSGGGAYSDFFNIKSSIRNNMDDFEIFFIAIFLSENLLTPGGWLCQFQYWSPLLHTGIFVYTMFRSVYLYICVYYV